MVRIDDAGPRAGAATAAFARGLVLAALGSLLAAAAADSVVVFNEIQYHPAGNEAGLEWIELHDQCAVDVDISGWSLAEGVAFTFPEGTVIPGSGYLVVAASPEALLAAAGFSGALGPFEGRLDNSGERLTLVDRDGRIMDTLRYSAGGDWPPGPAGSGATLAKRDPDLGSDEARSWVASREVGGTPGRRNFAGATAEGRVSWWNFDETSGAALDPAGGNPGTLGSGAKRTAGLVGSKAVTFDGTSGAYISVGSGKNNGFSSTTGVAIEALLNSQWSGGPGDTDAVFRKDDGTSRIFLALRNEAAYPDAVPAVAGGPVLSFGLNVGGTFSELALPLDGLEGRPALDFLRDGAVHHVAATYDASTGLKSICFDGRALATASLGPGKPVSCGGSSTAYIGNRIDRTEPFTGVLDEVAFWRRALSPTEVALHAANGRSGKTYFEGGGMGPGGDPDLRLNEICIPAAGAGWVEIAAGGQEVRLEGLILAGLDAQGGRTEYRFPAVTLPAGGLLAVREADTGVPLDHGGRINILSADGAELIDSAEVYFGLRGRFPDREGPWVLLTAPTPEGPNAFQVEGAIVINEIQYHPRVLRDAAGARESEEGWIELFNRDSEAVDLTGWSLADGISFDFPGGTILGPGEYLVVAGDGDLLRGLYPALRVLGNYGGHLSRRSDRIALLDPYGRRADEVEYFDEGRWPGYADGGGSSLELRDPRADNSRAEAWAASDESLRASWRSYSYRAVCAQAGVGPTLWSEFVLGLLDAGEVLLDDLSVVESPDGVRKQLLQDGGFEGGGTAWRMLGNHGRSGIIADPLDPSNHVLRLVATGPTEHMHNHIETTLAGGARAVDGRTYEVSFRAHWIAGSNLLNTRLYFNRLARTTVLEAPVTGGTPGARNSRAEEDIGPTFSVLRHEPVAPGPDEAVTVSSVASDPDGLAGADLLWSVKGGAWASAPMAVGVDGSLRGTIPGQTAGSLVQFYIQAIDGHGLAATLPAGGPSSRALYKVRDGQAVLGKVHNLRILMTPADTTLLHLETNVMSNERLGSTLVYDERLAVYDCGVRLKGSERGRPENGRVGFNLRLPPHDPFRGVHRSLEVDRSGGWRLGGPTGQDEILVKHIGNHAGGIPGMYDDLIRVIAPKSIHNGPALLLMAAFRDIYLDSRFPGGSDGEEYKFDLVYYPTTTINGRPDGLKRPQPDDVIGTDLRDLGNNPEAYRWTFQPENHEDRDSFGPLMGLCKAFGLPSATLDKGTRAVMDVDEWMRVFALYSLCGINDTYTQGNNHNNVYYRRPSDGLMLVFPWDMDFSFSRPTNASLWGDQNLSRIIQLTPNRRAFYRHLKDIIDTTFNGTYMARWIAHYGNLAGVDYSVFLSDINARRSFVNASLPVKIPFDIITQGGQDFSTAQTSAVIEGNAWFDVETIVAAPREEPLELAWTTASRWRATVPLEFGPNPLTFAAFDAMGTVVGSRTITITSTAGWPRPSITAMDRIAGQPGSTVRITGTDFHDGLQVLFGSGAAAVTFSEAADPGTIATVVPDAPEGPAPVSVRNSDGRSSTAAPFTILWIPRFIRGDGNLSGTMTISDPLAILFHLFAGSPAPCLEALNSNGDGTLDITDAIHLLNHLFLGGPPPPPPYPTAGPDLDGPTPLDCHEGLAPSKP